MNETIVPACGNPAEVPMPSEPQGREGMAKALREVESRYLQLQSLAKHMAKFIGEVRDGNLLPLYMRAEAKSLEERARGLLKDA